MHRSFPAVGQVTGTGAVISVNIGFAPKYVRLWNETALKTAECFDGLTAGYMLVVNDSGAGTTDLQKVTSNGITLTSNGFQIGTSSTINNNNDVIWYLAY
jgi:hypothetical protein